MQFDNPLNWGPDLQDAIETDPLIVSPQTPLIDAIALISQAHHHTCLLTDTEAFSNHSVLGVRASCILVMQEKELLGILTERDIVRLTAQGIDLNDVMVADVMVHPVITLSQSAIKDIFAALFLFRRYCIRHLPVVDDRRQLVGMISHESVRRILRPANLLRLRRVCDVMTTQVINAPLTASILQLAQLMAENRVSCVVIVKQDVEENLQPVGIVTERDVVQFQALQIDIAQTQAETVMSTPLFLLSPEDSLWTAHQEMQRRRLGRLVVSWNWGMGLGIVTQTSLLRVFDPMEMYGVIENLQQTIQQLKLENNEGSQIKSCGVSPIISEMQCQGNYHTVTLNLDDLHTSLDKISTSVKQLIDKPDLSNQQKLHSTTVALRSQLKSILDSLKQLDDKIRLDHTSHLK
ncbi:CBS domain-containing protein [Calothrix rhizosoleniae]|uniref:CBS domain-containing protein n=1 Tax=Calothrix rhizosoleniae TaxID=888997 RepID=UPI000B49D745|nr:CBS domain-containing protein [Calothrix rhizosoleniae]